MRVYQTAGHGFMNDHAADDVPLWARLASKVSRTRFDAPATQDARRRIERFFDQHLRS